MVKGRDDTPDLLVVNENFPPELVFNESSTTNFAQEGKHMKNYSNHHHQDDDDEGVTVRPLRFVLHLGPHKTATTIQCELTYFRSFLYKNSHIIYLGRLYPNCMSESGGSGGTPTPLLSHSVDTRGLINCLDSHSTTSPCHEKRIWKEFESTLKQLQKSSTDILMSDEAFSRMEINDQNLGLLFQTIQKYGFQLEIVLVYRHYFSWLTSQYNQHYKPLSTRSQFQKWPSQGGSYIQPFVAYYEKTFKGKTSSKEEEHASGHYQSSAHAMDLHPVAYLRQRWIEEERIDKKSAPSQTSVVIISMHEGKRNKKESDDIVIRFVQHAISDQAANLLTQHKNDQKSSGVPSRENPSLNLDFDRMTVQAILSKRNFNTTIL